MSDVAPALNMLLGIDRGLNFVVPSFCDTCVFSGDPVEPYEEVSHDLTEAHYRCELLERQVWGESPECKPSDWRERAKTELFDLLDNVEAHHARRELAGALKRRSETDA